MAKHRIKIVRLLRYWFIYKMNILGGKDKKEIIVKGKIIDWKVSICYLLNQNEWKLKLISEWNWGPSWLDRCSYNDEECC